MPGPEQIARQERREVETVEARGVSAVVRGTAADECLREEEQRRQAHEFEGGDLSGASRAKLRARRGPRAVPAEEAKLAAGKQHDGGAAQEKDQTEGAPQDGSAGGPISGQGVVRKIVRVGMRTPRPIGNRHPCRPGEESGERAKFARIGDGVGGEPTVPNGVDKVSRPVGDRVVEELCVAGQQRQRFATRIVAVLLETRRRHGFDSGLVFGRKFSMGVGEALPRDAIGEIESEEVEVLRREIRAEIGAVAPDRAVVHQAMLEKDLLAERDFGAGEDHLP
jgi:hypothetical protein